MFHCFRVINSILLCLYLFSTKILAKKLFKSFSFIINCASKVMNRKCTEQMFCLTAVHWCVLPPFSLSLQQQPNFSIECFSLMGKTLLITTLSTWLFKFSLLEILKALKFLNRIVLFKLQDCILELELHYVEICRSLVVGIKCRVAYWAQVASFLFFFK